MRLHVATDRKHTFIADSNASKHTEPPRPQSATGGGDGARLPRLRGDKGRCASMWLQIGSTRSLLTPMPANILNLQDLKVQRVEETEHDYHVYAETKGDAPPCGYRSEAHVHC